MDKMTQIRKFLEIKDFKVVMRIVYGNWESKTVSPLKYVNDIFFSLIYASKNTNFKTESTGRGE